MTEQPQHTPTIPPTAEPGPSSWALMRGPNLEDGTPTVGVLIEHTGGANLFFLDPGTAATIGEGLLTAAQAAASSTPSGLLLPSPRLEGLDPRTAAGL